VRLQREMNAQRERLAAQERERAEEERERAEEKREEKWERDEERTRVQQRISELEAGEVALLGQVGELEGLVDTLRFSGLNNGKEGMRPAAGEVKLIQAQLATAHKVSKPPHSSAPLSLGISGRRAAPGAGAAAGRRSPSATGP
jgi:hypothetical protein